MAINRNSSTNEELNLTINNGDLQALRNAATRLGFLNEESMLRYLLAVMSKSATRSVTITDQSGNKNPLSPSETLLRPDVQGQI